MNIDNPAALHFIMQDDIFLLNTDKSNYGANVYLADGDKEITQDNSTTISEKAESVAFIIDHLGDVKSGFMVLVYYPDHEFINDSHLAALQNALKRRGYEPGEVAIVNMAKNTAVNFENLTGHFKLQKVLILGKNALPQGISNIKFNELQNLANIALLHSFGFDEMMDSNENKKAFWEQMKLL